VLHRMVDPGEKYAALAIEIENLLTAHRWCGLDPARAVDGLMLVAPLGPLFTNTGLIELGRTVLAEAVQRAASVTAGEPRARALLALGKLHYFAGHPVMARVAFEQALALAQKMGHAVLAARLMADCADTYVPGGDPAVAVRLAADAVTAARRLAEDHDGLLVRAIVLNVSGTVLRYSGDAAGAEVAYQESLELWRRLDDPENEANTAMNVLGVRVLERRDDGLDGLLCIAGAAWTKTGSLWVARQVLRGAAGIAGLRGQWKRTVFLVGARRALEQRIHLMGTPALADGWLPAARAALGDTITDGALAEGASLDVAAAVGLALAVDASEQS